MGDMRHGTKADLLDLLQKTSPGAVVVDELPPVDAEILDGAAIVHMLPPRTIGTKTIRDYAADVFAPYVLRRLGNVQRLDIIWDRYLPDSLKQSTRDKRGTGERRRVSATTPIPSNWQSFLQVDSNKAELFEYLAEYCIKELHHEKVFITTIGTSVVSSDPHTDTSGMSPCNHEEADTRIMVHIADCVKQGSEKIAIRTTDTDVVVLAVSVLCQIELDELWLSFGTGKSFRYIAAHTILSNIGESKAKALPMFHSLTGCDTVSSFAGHGKKSCWDVWNVYPQLTDTFINLSNTPTQMSSDDFDVIQRFVVLVYSRTCEQIKVNDARKQLFSQGSRMIEHIPPTEAALLCKSTASVQYIKGCVFGDRLSLQTPTCQAQQTGDGRQVMMGGVLSGHHYPRCRRYVRNS